MRTAVLITDSAVSNARYDERVCVECVCFGANQPARQRGRRYVVRGLCCSVHETGAHRLVARRTRSAMHICNRTSPHQHVQCTKQGLTLQSTQATRRAM